MPILGSDSVKWIEVTIPSSFAATADADIPSTCTPLSHDCASSIAIGDPPTYLIWYFLILFLISNFLHFPILYIHFFGYIVPGESASFSLELSNYLSSVLTKNFQNSDCESLFLKCSLPLFFSAKMRYFAFNFFVFVFPSVECVSAKMRHFMNCRLISLLGAIPICSVH